MRARVKNLKEWFACGNINPAYFGFVFFVELVLFDYGVGVDRVDLKIPGIQVGIANDKLVD